MSGKTERTQAYPVCAAEEFADGMLKLIPYRSREIGIYRHCGRYYAMLNFCPHQWAKVCAGTFECTTVADSVVQIRQCPDKPLVRCPWHGWEFDLQDGHCLGDPRFKLKLFPVSVEAGIVTVWA